MSRIWSEMAIMFGIVALPSLFVQGEIGAEIAFDRLLPHLQAMSLALPQIALLLLIIDLQPDLRRSEFGIVAFTPSAIPPALLLGVGIMLSVLLSSGIAAMANMPSGARFVIGNRWYLLLALPTSLAIGYREELFFRAYLLTRLKQGAVPSAIRIPTSAVLFGIGHLYQGMQAIVVAIVCGILFAFVFERTRNLHIIALAHALYNVAGLAMASP